MVTPVGAVLRNILAPILALTGVSLTVVYGASCSGSQTLSPESPPESTPDSPPDRAGKPPPLGKFAQELPRAPKPRLPAPAQQGPSVAEVLGAGCSTTVVMGLSEQIIAEGNCIEPGAYARFPDRPNVTLGSAVFPYMVTGARDALVEATDAASKRPLRINSMLRTVAQQYLLYDWYRRGRCGIKLAAEPGKSNHQSGLAIDVRQHGAWRKTLSRHGFRWLGKRDRWHFDYAEVEPSPGLDVRAFQQLWNRNHPDEPIGTDGGWGPDTEDALRRSPAGGFSLGPVCEPQQTAEASDADAGSDDG